MSVRDRVKRSHEREFHEQLSTTDLENITDTNVSTAKVWATTL